jgi:hypothetical protein
MPTGEPESCRSQNRIGAAAKPGSRTARRLRETWMTPWPPFRIALDRCPAKSKEAQMAGVEVGDFGSPDETRAPDKTTIEVVRMGSANASRMRLEPGWRWSECVKPIVGGERRSAAVGHDARRPR